MDTNIELGRTAIVSDLHGNRFALKAVLDDLANEKIDSIVCLGDIIGYGPHPLECLDLIKKQAKKVILGNHDQAALFDPGNFNDAALASSIWTRGQIERSRHCESYFEYLGELERKWAKDGVMLVHGSPRRPTDEYVFPQDVYNERKLNACFDSFEHLSFQGHTHLPGIFIQGSINSFLESDHPDLEDKEFKFNADLKYMINVGSVGQPRDLDARACYVIFDQEKGTCRFRRVEYPIEDTIRELLAIEDFAQFRDMALRLRDGR